MKRNTLLKILNPILAILLANQVLTATLRWVLARESFRVIHTGGGIALAVAAVLHLILNWNWVKTNFSRGAPVSKA